MYSHEGSQTQIITSLGSSFPSLPLLSPPLPPSFISLSLLYFLRLTHLFHVQDYCARHPNLPCQPQAMTHHNKTTGVLHTQMAEYQTQAEKSRECKKERKGEKREIRKRATKGRWRGGKEAKERDGEPGHNLQAESKLLERC